MASLSRVSGASQLARQLLGASGRRAFYATPTAALRPALRTFSSSAVAKAPSPFDPTPLPALPVSSSRLDNGTCAPCASTPFLGRAWCSPCLLLVAISVITSILFHADEIHADARSEPESPWNPSAAFRGLLERRAKAELELRSYITSQRAKYAKLVGDLMKAKPGTAEAQRIEDALAVLIAEIEQKTHALIYGPRSTPQSRAAYLDEYGCTKVTPAAVKAITSRTRKVLEVGAGRGHWALALRQAGANVLAVDDFSDIPNNGSAELVTEVVKGSYEVVGKNPDRALLLVYPPPTPLALAALQAYQGKLLFYVGESFGGANGTEGFFAELMNGGWRVSGTIELDPFEGGAEKLWILERS